MQSRTAESWEVAIVTTLSPSAPRGAYALDVPLSVSDSLQYKVQSIR